MENGYEPPTLTTYGSVVSLTLGGPGSDYNGNSGRVGNHSHSDTIGGGQNDGNGPASGKGKGKN